MSTRSQSFRRPTLERAVRFALTHLPDYEVAEFLRDWREDRPMWPWVEAWREDRRAVMACKAA